MLFGDQPFTAINVVGELFILVLVGIVLIAVLAWRVGAATRTLHATYLLVASLTLLILVLSGVNVVGRALGDAIADPVSEFFPCSVISEGEESNEGELVIGAEIPPAEVVENMRQIIEDNPDLDIPEEVLQNMEENLEGGFTSEEEVVSEPGCEGQREAATGRAAAGGIQIIIAGTALFIHARSARRLLRASREATDA